MFRPTRLLALGGLVAIALLYWKPIHTYEHTRAQVSTRQAEVQHLLAQQAKLQKQLATVGTGEELVREARRLSLVKPGEQLFIVKGIAAWRKHH